ncbi:MAG: DUF438 domain-containing protein [candidate division KSB1 bacterium]|nr:DUF438 domain-containing protein [candidate division KSB1 bacterium]
MSEFINNSKDRKELLKHMILQLHQGEAPESVRKQLVRLLGQVPYNMVVEVEQELISEGLPQEEVLKLCDIHTAALDGAIDQKGSKSADSGHPVHTFQEENRALLKEIGALENVYERTGELSSAGDHEDLINEARLHFNALADVEKHYTRKENLLFPYLEKHDITGPPSVMWGKHDETRHLLKSSFEALHETDMNTEEFQAIVEMVLRKTSESIRSMIQKEEEILFPMCLDTLSDEEWYEIYRQSPEIGFCLYDPTDSWVPDGIETTKNDDVEHGRISLPSGGFSVSELTALLNTIPFDLTFVDKDDTVRFFTQGRERIFARNRAIIGRKVQQCHPPSSVHVVEKILNDFKSGKQDSAAFWIDMKGRFIHIEYFALKDENNAYLGTLEVSQDLTEKRQLEGEQRILSYNNYENK